MIRQLAQSPYQPTLAASFAVTPFIVVILLLSGICFVRPGEAAAVRVFGQAKPEPATSQGPHWNWPSPIGNTDVIQFKKIRTAAIGSNTLHEGSTSEAWSRDLEAATTITGDLNLIIEVLLVAHYFIRGINTHLFGASDPGHEYT